MAQFRKTWVACLVALGCLVVPGVTASAQADKNGVPIFSKADELTADDEKDTHLQLKNSPRKVYKLKLEEGKTYQIDLMSQDFDAVLRLEDSTGKEVAFNDDYKQGSLDSRLIHPISKTGEYRIIATLLDGKQTNRQNTGKFTLVVKLASEKDAAEAKLMLRVQRFADSSKDEQKKLVAELIKDFQAKGADVTMKDAQIAAQIIMSADESDVPFVRATGQSFSKIFEGASNKQLAGLSKFIEQQMKQLDKIGTEMEVTGMKTDGKEFDLKTLKGKVVLVDFWATWCGPCIAELPNIQAAYKKYHGKGFEVIGISLDRKDDDEKLVKFITNHKLPWGCINIEDSAKLAKTYQVNSIPYPVLIGADGRVVSLRARGPQLERLLARLLDEKK